MNGEDFVSFFEQIHGHGPFPWQSRLARELCATNAWPTVLDLPTGSGKTSCIDIALFHWLVSAHRGAPADAARRIAFVVDRRIIVDEASVRARKISTAIAAAPGGILAAARRVMLEKAGDATIGVFTLRGGVARERNIARDPTRVTVVLSTVDQVGSRLLFRGYGVSDRMKPVHAGVFGTDTLLLLDEAHIAEPFRQTLEGIVREQRRAVSGHLGPKPLRWAQLSATPSDEQGGARVFSLDEHDRAHPVLSRRLQAKKPLRLFEVDKREGLPGKLVELVEEELAAPRLSDLEEPRIGIVVNRVATARGLHEALRKALKDTAEVELLIGRSRPIDRDAYIATLAPKLKSSAEPREGEKPIVVVATQTIEVGADFDFHAMFVEAASYAAIKQRVGRLNRLGVRDLARGAIVLVRADADEDPIYGKTIAPTWALLQSHATDGVVDLGILGAPAPVKGSAPEAPPAPLLSPSLLSLFVQTCPRPAVEPDVSEFLHGFSTQVPDVSVVWRDGLTATDRTIDGPRAQALLKALPPLSAEAMSLPFSTFKQWVAGWGAQRAPKIADGGDLEGDSPILEEDTRDASDGMVLRVTGEDFELVPLRRVRPADQIVVPSERGGADRYGFKPDDTTPVRDLSLVARDPTLCEGSTIEAEAAAGRRERTLVWTRELAASWLSTVPEEERAGQMRDLVDAIADDDATPPAALDELDAWFNAYDGQLPDDVAKTYANIRKQRRMRAAWLDVDGERGGFVLREGKVASDDLVEGGGGLQKTVRVELADHNRGVGELAAAFARSVGLEQSLVKALRTAGVAHDLGKADPRFQKRLGAREGELLAKSDEYDASVPVGERHEVYSVALLDRHPELLAEVSEHRDLIRYLVGSHHGHGRAAHPVTDDAGIDMKLDHGGHDLSYAGRPALHALDSGWTELFVSQNRKYGPWTLAFLESILRLADHRRSEQEISDEWEKTEGEGA